MKTKITVYVQSAKVLTSEKRVVEPYPIKRASRASGEMLDDLWFQSRIKKEFSHVLPKDQEALVETVKRLSELHGCELEVIDVSKRNIIYRLLRRAGGIKNFPGLEVRRGLRLSAPFSQSELESFISQNLKQR